MKCPVSFWSPNLMSMFGWYPLGLLSWTEAISPSTVAWIAPARVYMVHTSGTTANFRLMYTAMQRAPLPHISASDPSELMILIR